MGIDWKDRSDANKSLFKWYAVASLFEKDENEEGYVDSGENKTSFLKLFIFLSIFLFLVFFVLLLPSIVVIWLFGLQEQSKSAMETAMNQWHWWILSLVTWGAIGLAIYKVNSGSKKGE